MNKLFVIGIKTHDGHGCWLCDGEGDPARTLKIESAKVFTSYVAANNLKAKMQKQFTNRQFWVESVEVSDRKKVA